MKVQTDSALALLSFAIAAHMVAMGRFFVLENPTRSFMWELEEAKELAATEGVFLIEVTNCMFADGVRAKRTTFMTNMRELVEALRGRICTGGAQCSRTGLAHERWEPMVYKGEVTGYTTGSEAEYPRELCAALARGTSSRA